MKIVTALGLFAAFLTTLSQAPQLIKTVKTKSTEDISLWMYIFLNAGLVLWLVYGLLIKDLPLILCNSISLMLALGVFMLKLKYYDQ